MARISQFRGRAYTTGSFRRAPPPVTMSEEEPSVETSEKVEVQAEAEAEAPAADAPAEETHAPAEEHVAEPASEPPAEHTSDSDVIQSAPVRVPRASVTHAATRNRTIPPAVSTNDPGSVLACRRKRHLQREGTPSWPRRVPPMPKLRTSTTAQRPRRRDSLARPP